MPPEEHQPDHPEERKDEGVVSHIKHPLIRAASLAGLIILLILGAWGIIRVALYLPTAFQNAGGAIVSPFASIFGGSTGTSTPSTPSSQAPDFSLTGPATTTASGQPFTITWTPIAGAGNYSYKISYACTNGFSLEAPLPNGQYQTVPCDTPFNYTDAQNSITLIPHIAGNQGEVSVPFSISAQELATGQTSSASSLLGFEVAHALLGGSGAPAVSGGTPGTTGTTGAAAVKYRGPADLSVRFLSVTPAGAQFEIRNIGGTAAPAGWLFTAALPVSPAYTYVSAPQQALGAGSYIVYTLGWSSQPQQNCTSQAYPYQQYPYYTSGYNYPYGSNQPYYPQQNCYSSGTYGGSYYAGGTLTIVADARGIVRDANRANNTASTVVY